MIKVEVISKYDIALDLDSIFTEQWFRNRVDDIVNDLVIRLNISYTDMIETINNTNFFDPANIETIINAGEDICRADLECMYNYINQKLDIKIRSILHNMIDSKVLSDLDSIIDSDIPKPNFCDRTMSTDKCRLKNGYNPFECHKPINTLDDIMKFEQCGLKYLRFTICRIKECADAEIKQLQERSKKIKCSHPKKCAEAKRLKDTEAVIPNWVDGVLRKCQDAEMCRRRKRAVSLEQQLIMLDIKGYAEESYRLFYRQLADLVNVLIVKLPPNPDRDYAIKLYLLMIDYSYKAGNHTINMNIYSRMGYAVSSAVSCLLQPALCFYEKKEDVIRDMAKELSGISKCKHLDLLEVKVQMLRMKIHAYLKFGFIEEANKLLDAFPSEEEWESAIRTCYS